MKMIFVDAENIGVKELEKVQATVIDKVFVFSKVESVQRVCEKSLFLFLSNYPSGPNQADFYIIAYLSRVLAVLDKQLLAAVSFELYSNDESLISAFNFQCEQQGTKAQIIRTKNGQLSSDVETAATNVAKISTAQSQETSQDDYSRVLSERIAQYKICYALKSPQALDLALQAQLGLSQLDFARAITALIKSQRIRRTARNKKKWISC